MPEARKRLSIVLPVFNEEACIEKLIREVKRVLADLPCDHELVFVDDGSTDGSLERLKTIAREDAAVRVVSFSRNFGHQAALSAGLDYARGDAVIMMDADLQHPPNLIPRLVHFWEQGYDVVYTRRRDGRDIPWLKRVTSRWFYRVFRRLSGLDVDFGLADFRLLDRKVVRLLISLPERNRFLRGLVKWVGFRQKCVTFRVRPRAAGRSKYSFWSMVKFATVGLLSFSTVPLKLATWLGFGLTFLNGLYLAYVLFVKFFTDRTIPGWTSIIMAILLIGGVQLICLGILGEYLGQLYDEIKARPRYIVREVVESSGIPSGSAESTPGDR